MNLFKIFKKILRGSFIVIMISLITSPYLLAQNNESKIITAEDEKTNNESVIDTSSFTLKNKDSISKNNSFNLSPQTPQIEQNVHQYYQKQLKQEKIENSFFTASLISLLVLNVADYISTKKALKYEGVSEGNPFLKPLVNNDLAFLAVKTGLTVGNHYLMKKLYKTNKPLAWVVSIASNFIMSYIVANNFKIIQNMNGK